jgi:Fe-S cluster assembly ATP-binding protein
VSNSLEITDLHVQVDHRTVLHGVDLVIPESQIHALLGPNGGGKTSLMMAIMGYPQYTVTRGSILFDGQDIASMNLTERARLGIGMAHQRPPTVGSVRLRQIVDYVMGDDAQLAYELTEWVQAARMESLLERRVNKGLSGGEIKRSELLQLLSMQPRLVLLDEPDSGVDVDALGLVGKMVNRLLSADPDHPVRRRAGLVISHTGHILERVDVDRAHVMMHGRIVCSGNPRLIFDTACTSGYEACIQCMLAEKEMRDVYE